MSKRQQVVIVGCGVVGAAIAYTLSKTSLQVTVLEANTQVAQGATGASLGVLMAACSQKPQGDLVTLRLASLNLYEHLMPELVAKTDIDLAYNRAGILCLSQDQRAESKWRSLISVRQSQGFELQALDRANLQTKYPQFQADIGLYSPQDRALNPTRLVQALVKGARSNGVQFECDRPVHQLQDLPDADWIVLAAGVGSNHLLQDLPHPPLIEAIGGQAIKVRLSGLGLKPVVHGEDINGKDINIVPLRNDEYWVGATVEFSPEQLPREANVPLLIAKAEEFCPAFAGSEVLETWAGYRPRPKLQRSPILGFHPQHKNILLATGHYRNGVLMAPVTAKIICDLILDGDSNLPWRNFQLQHFSP